MASVGKPFGTLVKYFHKAVFSVSTLTSPSRYFKGLKILYQGLKYSLRSSHENEI